MICNILLFFFKTITQLKRTPAGSVTLKTKQPPSLCGMAHVLKLA